MPHDDEAVRIDVDGGQLQAFVSGQGEAVVFIHAGIADARMWVGQIPAFQEHYSTVRFDLRGFGRSSIPEEPFSYSDDLLALLEQLDIERAHLVGSSFGAHVTIDFVLQYPSRVRSLVAVGPGISGAGWEDPGLIEGWTAMEAARRAGDLDRMIEIEAELWIAGSGRSLNQIAPTVRKTATEMLRGTYQDGWDEELVQEPHAAAYDRLAEITCPVLVVVGEYDRPDIQRNARDLATHAANGRLVVMPESAHLPPLEHSERFNQIVIEFLESLAS